MPNWKKIILSGSDANLSSLNIDGSLTASSALLTSASIGHLETIYETASVIYSSGSTKFGDTLDDTHEITGSLLVTGSITGNLIGTASIADELSGLATASFAITASHALNVPSTASHALTAVTASHTAGTASLANNAVTSSYALTGDGVFSGSFSGSFIGDASNLNVNPFPFTGSGELQGDLTVHSLQDYTDEDYVESYFAGTAIYSDGDIALTGSIFSAYINANQFTGSLTGSVSGSITGSVLGTASFSETSQTASFVEIAQTASFVEIAQTASFVETAQTASFVEIAQTASFVETAQTASFVETAQTASFVEIAQTASFVENAQTASFIETASFASSLKQGIDVVLNSGSFNFISSPSASFGYITSITGSSKLIGDAFIELNNDTPTQRYAGIKVIDSGSLDTTASLFFDGQLNDWNYEYFEGGNTDYGVLMFGPEYNTQGSPTYLTNNTIPKGNGGHHLNDSSITDNGSVVTIGNVVTFTNGASGSLHGNVTGDLTGNASTATSATSASEASTLRGVHWGNVNTDIIPNSNGVHDLGSSANRWNTLYTSDLSLSNGIGDYTIVEGEEDLFLYNNKSGKTFKFALIEVDPSQVPAKRD